MAVADPIEVQLNLDESRFLSLKQKTMRIKIVSPVFSQQVQTPNGWTYMLVQTLIVKQEWEVYDATNTLLGTMEKQYNIDAPKIPDSIIDNPNAHIPEINALIASLPGLKEQAVTAQIIRTPLPGNPIEGE